MGPMIRVGMLIGIIGSVCCILIGCAIAAVRIVKLLRRERFPVNRNWVDLQVGKVDSYTDQEDTESKSADA